MRTLVKAFIISFALLALTTLAGVHGITWAAIVLGVLFGFSLPVTLYCFIAYSTNF